MPIQMPTQLERFREMAASYDVLLCDVWGVVHDGLRAYPGANEVLPRFRSQGGTVVLVSNAPMTSEAVANLLDQKGVSREAWDHIVTSGDIALTHIAERGYRRIHGVGPLPRDSSFFERLPASVPLAEAECIACTGLLDDYNETVDDYRTLINEGLAHGLPFVCANPDLAVHVGERLLPCAGAIADFYERSGGAVFWAGKPHPIAYATGLKAAERLRGRPVLLSRVLGIGDAIRTDLASAVGAGVDALFIAGGLHRDEIIDHNGSLDPAAIAQALEAAGMPAKAVMHKLAW